METLEQYFDRPDSPAADSPAGRLIVRYLDKYPSATFDDARAEVHTLLAVSAKARVYRSPVVLSAEALATRKAASAEYWKERKAANGTRETALVQ